MARCLIIGCGGRGMALASDLIAQGHAVRGTTRRPEQVAQLEQLGVEAVVGDPDRVATLARALEHVSVAFVLLGSAEGPDEAIEALHTTRLDMLLTKMLDSTVRGIVYEAAGTVREELLDAGVARVTAFCEDSRVPYALLRTPAGDCEAWLPEARAALERVLAPPLTGPPSHHGA